MKPLFLALFGLFLFLMGPFASAEPQFNALPPSDPQYANYQAALCKATQAEYAKVNADKYWLDHLDPKIRQMPAEERENWAVNYVVTAELRNRTRAVFAKNCTVAARHE